MVSVCNENVIIMTFEMKRMFAMIRILENIILFKKRSHKFESLIPVFSTNERIVIHLEIFAERMNIYPCLKKG